MNTEPRKLSEVYGVTRDLPLNYVPRASTDGLLVESLTRDKHIVIHGSSKQGKTSLRKWNLKEDDYILVSCQARWGLAELHAAILKKIGYRVEQSSSRTTSGENKIKASMTMKLIGKLMGSGAEAAFTGGAEIADGWSEETSRASLELDPADPNDIITALTEVGFGKFIVLEDFHYLPDETQAEFAVALKTFHEASSFIFVVIGVWLDENRLIQHNGDLVGRIETINADAWTPDELREVVAKGAELLNVSFDSKFVEDLIRGSFDSVWVVQEACYRACETRGVLVEQGEHVDGIGGSLAVADLIRAVVEAQSARYNGFLEHFPDGFQTTELEMYRWIALAAIQAGPSDLEDGLHLNSIKAIVNTHHPRRPVNDMNISQALKLASNLQVKKNIKPIILDYDQTARKLTVVDRSFLIWLEHQDRAELLVRCGMDPAAAAALDLK